MEPSARAQAWLWSRGGPRDSRLSVIFVLTLLLILLHADDYWYIRGPSSILVLAGFFRPGLTRSSGYWLLLAVVSGFGNAINWQWADNHKYLITYWCLALALAMRGLSPLEDLRESARLLIGLSFAFAVFWKVTTKDFVNGDFFVTSLLFDERFGYVARAVAGMIRPVVAMNHAAQHALIGFDSSLSEVSLTYTAGVRIFARFFTYWALATESLVAVSFLRPGDARTFGLRRDHYLLAFLFSTYAIASVIGFGWVLATMGYAQLRRDAPRSLGRLYLLAVVVMQAYKLPWRMIFGYLTGSG
jgi:hypothetical protein